MPCASEIREREREREKMRWEGGRTKREEARGKMKKEEGGKRRRMKSTELVPSECQHRDCK